MRSRTSKRFARVCRGSLVSLAGLLLMAIASEGCSSSIAPPPDGGTGIVYSNPHCDPANTWMMPHKGFAHCTSSSCDPFQQFESKLDGFDCLAGGIGPGIDPRFPNGARAVVHEVIPHTPQGSISPNLWLYALCAESSLAYHFPGTTPANPADLEALYQAWKSVPPVNTEREFCFRDGTSSASPQVAGKGPPISTVFLYDPRCQTCAEPEPFADPNEYDPELAPTDAGAADGDDGSG